MRSPTLFVVLLTGLMSASLLAAAEDASTWREPMTGIEFVRIPGGSYEQGCGPWTSECRDREKPVRRVTLSPFWLGKTEVTQGQWKRVMEGNPAAFQRGDDYPVEQVSWKDAQEFINRLNARSSNETFRLPTEAEWEYACRAGGKKVSYGTQNGEIGEGLAQFAKRDGPSPVGQYAANGLGLHDMSGNVAEWVEDVIDSKGYAPGNAMNPLSQSQGGFKGNRGGAFFSTPSTVRCSARTGHYDDVRKDFIGFRVVRGKSN